MAACGNIRIIFSIWMFLIFIEIVNLLSLHSNICSIHGKHHYRVLVVQKWIKSVIWLHSDNLLSHFYFNSRIVCGCILGMPNWLTALLHQISITAHETKQYTYTTKNLIEFLIFYSFVLIGLYQCGSVSKFGCKARGFRITRETRARQFFGDP